MSLLKKGNRGLILGCLCVLASGGFATVGTGKPGCTWSGSITGGDTTTTSSSHSTTMSVASPILRKAETPPLAVTAAALDPLAAGADPLTVEPRVPRAAGTPCVVDLVHDVGFTRLSNAAPFTYSPPAACPGRWSKVVFVMDLTGPRPVGNPAANISILLDNTFTGIEGATTGGTIFMGAPQENDALALWRVERDVTDYSALFRIPQLGFLLQTGDNEYLDPDFLSITARSARLVFYPATTQTPAQRVPDAIVAIEDFSRFDSEPPPGILFPRNIERVYLDVTAQATNGPGRFWFSCVPSADAGTWPVLRSQFAMGELHSVFGSPGQGCVGGSYREVEIRIDGQLAGLAPLFPWLPSTINNNFRNTLDDPAPSVQSLNFAPYRVDLTPFAGLLNDGAPHVIQAFLASGEPAFAAGTFKGHVLMYLDKGRTRVTGAVTGNTLAAQPSIPIVQDGLALTGDTLQGDIVTSLQRQYTITGYVDTSHGRIRSVVWQNSRFVNTQSILVVDGTEHDYTQNVRLSSTVDRISRRYRGTTLLREDREYRSYPLILDYTQGGQIIEGDEGDYASPWFLHVKVHQARGIRATHFRMGMPRYDTHLGDVFDAAHDWVTTDDPWGLNPIWNSARSYRFEDTFGSCYRATLTTDLTELTSRTRGVDCPNDRNALRWYAHPDGSPDDLGWGVSQP